MSHIDTVSYNGSAKCVTSIIKHRTIHLSLSISYYEVLLQVCTDVINPREVCNEVPNEVCQQVSAVVTKQVDQEECSDVSVRKCAPATRQQCSDVDEKVPRQTFDTECNTEFVEECSGGQGRSGSGYN